MSWPRAKQGIALFVFALVAVTGVLAVFHPTPASAAVSSTLNFQARLETAAGAIVPDGNYNVEFKLYDAASGGTLLWTEDHTYNSGPGSSDARLRVAKGYLTVNLGSVTAFPGTINWNQQLWATMNIGGTSSSSVSWDGEMSPRLQLTAVPYAFQTEALGNGSNQAILDASGNLIFQQASTIQALSAATGTTLTVQGGAATSGTNVGGNLLLQGGAGAGTGVSGSVIVKSNVNNSTIAFQVQNAGGTAVLAVDTSGGQVVLGTAGTLGGKLTLYSGTASNTNTVSITTGNTAASYSLTLPTGVGSSGECLTTTDSAGTLGWGPCGSSVAGGIIASANDTTTRDYTAVNTWESIAGTTINFTAPNTGTYLVNVTVQVRGLTSNWTQFRHQLLLDGSTASVTPSMYVTSQNSGNDNSYVYQLSMHFVLSNIASGAHTIVLQTNDGNSGLHREYNNTMLTLSGSTGNGSTLTLQNTYENSLGGTTPSIKLNSTVGTLNIQDANTTLGADLLDVRASNASGLGSVLLGLGNTGQATLRNSADSTTAFQVQNAAGRNLLTVDTTNSNVGIGISLPSNSLSVSPLDYQAGTVTRTNGSATLAGTGTTWTSSVVGDIIIFADGTTNTVSAFTDATHITMGTTYSGTTDASPVTYRFHKIGLQVTSAGNVGIGTTSPSYPLQVAGSVSLVSGNAGTVYIGTQDSVNEGAEIDFAGAGSYTKTVFDRYDQLGRYFWNDANTGNTNQLQVFNAGTGTAGLYVQGNVGIGTTGPGSKLEVNGSITITNGSAGSIVWPSGGSNTYIGEVWGLRYPGDTTHPLQVTNGALLVGYTASGGSYAAGSISAASAIYEGSDIQLNGNQINLQSGSGNTEIAFNYSGRANIPLSIYNGSGGLQDRINPSGSSYIGGGYLGVGTSGPGAPLRVYGQMGQGQLRLQSTGTSAYWNLGPDSSSNNIVVYSSGGGGAYMLNTAYTWSGRSDERLKTNIVSLSTDDPLSKVMQLNPVSFDWKNVPQSGITNLGFIAQQVQQVFPELVSDSGNTTITLADGSQQTIHDVLGIEYDGLISPTIAALQQLAGQVQNQQATIAALQANTNFAALNVSGEATVGSLTVTGDAVFKANILVNGHIVTAGNTPTAAALTAAGSDTQGMNTGTCTVTGDDTSGGITITTGSSNVVDGAECTITFAQPFSAVPHPVLTPINKNSVEVGAYVNVTANDMTIYFDHVPQPHYTYAFNFINLQ